MARYIDADEFLKHFSQGSCSDDIIEALQEASAADVVEVGVFQDWLNEIAFNNVGVDAALVNACIEIISRLDGLRIFARERRDKSGED